MNNAVNIYRSDGQWVIEIEAEEWVLDDILFDSERKKPMPVKVLLKKEKEYASGGTTHFMNDNEPFVASPTELLAADVVFKEVE